MTDRKRSNSPSDLLAIPEHSSLHDSADDVPVFSASIGGLARRPLNFLEHCPRPSGQNYINYSQSYSSFNNGNLSSSSTTSSSTTNVLVRRGSVGTNAPSAVVRRNSNGYRRLSLSRDPAQPSSGSVSNLRCRSLPPENEEADVLGNLLSNQPLVTTVCSRPRSFTCPDLETRRIKSKIRNRPPTPPPSETRPSDSSAEALFSDQAVVGFGRRSRHSSRDRMEMTGLDELLPAISES